MLRQRALKVVLVLVGLLFVAGGTYFLIFAVQDGWRANKERIEPMFLSLYVTQGAFLLLAALKPSVNRGIITVVAWLNIAHALVMTVMAIHLPNERQDLLVGSAVFAGIGVILIALNSPPELNA
jgi:hypothetical protein